jgi:fatty acid desaturase
MKEKRDDNFNFKWKLTENYFNATMVLIFTLLIIYAYVYNSFLHLVLAGLWGVVCPFIATFFDKKSHEGKRR